MIDFFVGLAALTLFGSVFWFWFMFGLFILLCFIFDIKENGYYAFATLVVVSIVSYFWANDAFEHFKSILTLKNILIYLGVGGIYSVFKSFFMGRKLKLRLDELPETSTDSWVQTKEKEKINFIKKLEGSVFRWLFMWPISLINWLIKDLLRDMWNFCWKKIKNFYVYIVELGIKSA